MPSLQVLLSKPYTAFKSPHILFTSFTMKLPSYALIIMGLYVANVIAMPINTNENEARNEDGTDGEEAC